jgi:polyisoprenoid-binding protein YceI
MKTAIKSFVVASLLIAGTLANGFDVNRSGSQTFSFKDKMGSNQATFFSTAPLEDITGMSTDVWGNVSFDVEDITNTLEGKVKISTASLESGIDLRDEHIRSADWLNAEEYPEITFNIKDVKNVKEIDGSNIKVTVIGEFTLHGVTKEVKSDVDLTYLEESELTKMRLPGDLLSVRAKFNIKLSDFGVQHMVLGKRVSDEIEISVNIVGSNKV